MYPKHNAYNTCNKAAVLALALCLLVSPAYSQTAECPLGTWDQFVADVIASDGTMRSITYYEQGLYGDSVVVYSIGDKIGIAGFQGICLQGKMQFDSLSTGAEPQLPSPAPKPKVDPKPGFFPYLYPVYPSLKTEHLV